MLSHLCYCLPLAVFPKMSYNPPHTHSLVKMEYEIKYVFEHRTKDKSLKVCSLKVFSEFFHGESMM